MCSCPQSVLKSALKQTYDNYKQFKYETIETKDYLFVKGDAPICLVCHLDTVWEKSTYRFKKGGLEWIHDKERSVLWSPDCAGFDDRVGTYLALECMDLHPSVLFCCDEEVGGVGAQQFCNDYLKFPADIKYFIELDRAYTDDCVFYLCENKTFQDYIESCGFVTDVGSFSDIYFLGPHFDIACTNLSVGYFDEHTQGERLYYLATDATLEKVRKMIVDSHSTDVPKYKHGKPKNMKLGYQQMLAPSQAPTEEDYLKAYGYGDLSEEDKYFAW